MPAERVAAGDVDVTDRLWFNPWEQGLSPTRFDRVLPADDQRVFDHGAGSDR